MRLNVSKLTRTVLGTTVVLLIVGTAFAQQETLEIRNGEIVSVDGNHLVVRSPMGVRAFDVPDDFRFNMDGRTLTVRDLKPGMPISAVIKTVETPIEMTQTEIKQGKVIHTIGSAFVVKTQDGQHKKFTAKSIEAQHLIIYKDGKPISPYQLKKGDHISATIVTELPPQIITESELAVFVQKPPTPPPPMVVAKIQRAPAPPPAPARRPAALPKTASGLPWVGLAGGLALALGAGLTMRRLFAR